MRESRPPSAPGAFLACAMALAGLTGHPAQGQLAGQLAGQPAGQSGETATGQPPARSGMAAAPRSLGSASRSAPSPVAPGDLSKPVFDTTTPVYGTGGASDKSAATVVAEVEGHAITLGDIGDAIRALPPALAQLPFEALYPGVVEQLIKQQALVIRAQQQGADEDPLIRRRVRAAADRALANEYARREVGRGITEAMLLERYKRDVAGKPGKEEVRARVILIATEKEGLDLIAELRTGADFALAARRSSKDTTASVGGDLGFNTREGLTPEVGAVAFALPPGQVAPYPVLSGSGWFVVKVEERRRAPAPAFAAARDSLTQGLLREGVPPLTAAVVEEMKVREYNLLGKEVDPEKTEAR